MKPFQHCLESTDQKWAFRFNDAKILGSGRFDEEVRYIDLDQPLRRETMKLPKSIS